jgi:hypothetical protein
MTNVPAKRDPAEYFYFGAGQNPNESFYPLIIE